MRIVCRCLPEWHGLVPEPVPAAQGLPDWLRAMPREAVSGALGGASVRTVKQCPPFVDAMGTGVLFPLIADLHVRDGTFEWNTGLPAHPLARPSRSPIGVHVAEQLLGAWGRDADAFAVKFTNAWTVLPPPGHAMLYGHPANRLDLPFRTLSGRVEGHADGLVHFPALWVDDAFEDTLPAGTPVAQAVAVPVERLELVCETMDEAAVARHAGTIDALQGEPGHYRRVTRRA